MEDLSLQCWVYGGDSRRTFFVDISTTRPVADLKEAIKKKKSVKFRDIDADDLDLYLYFPSGRDTLNQQLTKWSLVGQTCLETGAKLSGLGLQEDSVIIVNVPGSEVKLNCWIYGEDADRTFPVKIPGTETVGDLKKAIKSENPVSFQSVDPRALDLYLFSPSGGDILKDQLKDWTLDKKEPLDPEIKLSNLHRDAESLLIINFVPSLAHPPSSTTAGKTIKAARLKFLEDNPAAAPSSAGQSQLFSVRQTQPNNIIHCNRPGTAVAPIPVTLLHPAIGQLLDDCETHNITAADHSFTSDLYVTMSDFHLDEATRAQKTREVFSKHGLDLRVSGIGVKSSYKTDGDISLKGKYRYVIAEFKNEVGWPGAEPYLQASLYYLEATRQYAGKTVGSPFPCIILLFFGAYMSIVGAAWNLRPVIQPLSTLHIFYHPSDTGMRIKVARHLGALKKAVRTLKEYYRNLESETSPAPSQPQLLPHPTSFTPLEGDRDREDFKYTDQPSTDKLLFFGTLSDLHPVCIKFVRRYSKDAHLACAKLGHAPMLLGFEKISGGWFMVVMERLLSEKYVLLHSSTPTPPLVDNIRSVLTALHQEGYVHGDVRDTNIMVCKSDETKFMLIDFDWAGKIEEVRYPMNVYRGPDLWRPEGAIDEELILANHDLDMLNNIAGRYMTIVD